MAIQSQINTVNCEGNGVLGTGLAGCRMDRKRVTAIGLLQKGYKFTADITKDSLQTLQLSGKLVMLQGVISFADNTADDNIITREGSGIKVVAGKNPYEFTATFDNGINFHKALTALSSYQAYDMILFDVDSTLFCTVTKAGEPKGFTLGMFENGKYMGANGTDAASQTVSFQLIDRAEIDERMSWIDSQQLDFTYDDLQGVNEVLVQVSPMAAAATSITVSAFLLDKTHPVEGLVVANFAVTKNGNPLVPSLAAYIPQTKKYVLTVSALAANDAITVSLNGVVKTLAGVLYKSNTVNAVVV